MTKRVYDMYLARGEPRWICRGIIIGLGLQEVYLEMLVVDTTVNCDVWCS